VGVINPDLWLERPDFRASERAWQMLWEACERTGEGSVIVQTRHPDHYVMTSVAHQDKPLFYRHELKFRAELGYPPFSRLARIVVRANDASQAEGFATTIHQTLAAHVPESATLYAPAPLTPVTRSRQWQLVVKSDQTLPQWVGQALAPFRSRRPSGVRLEIDIDPIEAL
jgi:primosomal protein N' (replication factor Y)